MASTSWWAKVKYSARYGASNFDEVQVSKIQEEYEIVKKKKTKLRRRAFTPESLTDFKTNVWYIIWTSKDVEGGVEKPFWGLIGRLSETKDGLEEEDPRIRWPFVTEKADEPDTNPEDSSGEKNLAEKQREARLQVKRQRTDQDKEIFEGFMSASSLKPDGESVDTLMEKIRVLEAQAVQHLAELDAATKEAERAKREAAEQQAAKVAAEEEAKRAAEQAKLAAEQAARNASFSSSSLERSIDKLTESVNDMKGDLSELTTKVNNIVSEMSKSSPTKSRYVLEWIKSLPENY